MTKMSYVPDRIIETLLKAYDCANNDLVIEKLKEYRVDKNNLRRIHIKFTFPKTTRGKSLLVSELMVRDWELHQSISWLILFNIISSDFLLLIKETDICNFADDATIHAGGKDLDATSSKLEQETNTTTKWLKCTVSGLRQFLAFESPLKMGKNVFYFTAKALFDLKIFKFLSWVFYQVEKRLD